MDAASEFAFARHADELEQSWQVKVLRRAHGRLYAVMLSVLAHNFDDAMPVLMRVAFKGFYSIQPPFLVSAGRIAKTGHVMADIVTKDGQIVRGQGFFRSTKDMEGQFRRLADRIRLSDAEREEMFAAIRNWVVADYRLDPRMDPADPDARRLVH